MQSLQGIKFEMDGKSTVTMSLCFAHLHSEENSGLQTQDKVGQYVNFASIVPDVLLSGLVGDMAR